jgi:hypothetical protein
MKQKKILLSGMFMFFVQLSIAQYDLSKYLVRSTTSIAGSSEKASQQNEQYFVQQSIGQSSVIGTFYELDYTIRQGFLQPNVFAKIVNTAIPLNLKAFVYPNPFTENITISFSEKISSMVEVSIFDLLGRLVYANIYEANQVLNIHLEYLPSGNYIIKLMANNKQFVNKIIKK